MFDILLKNATCVAPTSQGLALVETDIAVQDDKIAAIGSGLTAASIIDLKGLTILPGIIDSQVHFREPGLTHKEDFESGSRAAVLGGVTAVFEMPNTKPAIISRETFEDKMRHLQNRVWCDYALYVGATPDNSAQLAELETLPGCCGVKIFMGSSTGSLLVPEDEHLLRCLQSGKRRTAVHAEDEARLKERKALLGAHPHVRQHPEWRDEETGLRATQRLVALAEKSQRPIHVLHVTTAEELAFLREQKARGRVNVTVEILPQHLLFAAPDCYNQLGTRVQMNPPIRSQRHQEAIWKALLDGTVDVIGTDHAPHTLEEKARPYPESPSGMPGVQTLVPLLLNWVHQGRMPLTRVAHWVSQRPAEIVGVKNKGQIRVGYDADFTIVDLQKQHTIRDSEMASKCGWTPYDGMKITGWPVMTMIRGHWVMRDGQLLDKPIGKPLHFI